MTVSVCPAIVAVPDRGACVRLALTVIDTDPLPVPDAAPLTDIQSTFEVAVHVHVGPVVIVTGPVMPPAGTDALVGEIV